MPAMRFFMSVLFLISFSLAAAAADLSVTKAKPAVVHGNLADTALGPLTPQERKLDRLFQQLKMERSPEQARSLADQIRETLTLSGSATVDMLMANCSKAMTQKRYGAALDFVDQITLIDPKYAEGWNRRATIHYLMGNYGKSMADTAHTLTLEPRHLGALSGLAGILEDGGRDTQALKAWETYIALYPADRDAQKEALDLIDKLSGQKT